MRKLQGWRYFARDALLRARVQEGCRPRWSTYFFNPVEGWPKRSGAAMAFGFSGLGFFASRLLRFCSFATFLIAVQLRRACLLVLPEPLTV